jgi:hypothetical protein
MELGRRCDASLELERKLLAPDLRRRGYALGTSGDAGVRYEPRTHEPPPCPRDGGGGVRRVDVIVHIGGEGAQPACSDSTRRRVSSTVAHLTPGPAAPCPTTVRSAVGRAVSDRLGGGFSVACVNVIPVGSPGARETGAPLPGDVRGPNPIPSRSPNPYPVEKKEKR